MNIFKGEKFPCPQCKRRVGLTAGERYAPHGVGWRCTGSLRKLERRA